MNTKPMSLIQLAKAVFLGFLNRGRKKHIKLPRQIGEYRFYKRYKTNQLVKTFAFGIYKNSTGKKAIAKVWNGSVKDLFYYSLKNELKNYEILTQLINRLENSIPKQFSNFKIPLLLGWQETNNSLVILLEYIEGKVANKLKPEEGFEIYLKSAEFMNFLGRNLHFKERQQFSTRSPKIFSLMYFPFLAKALLTHPRAAKELLLSLPAFLQSTPYLLKRNGTHLCHRDLNLNHIITMRKKIIIIDLQYSLFTDGIYEFINSLRMRWDDNFFRAKLFQEIENRFGNTKETHDLIKGLLVFSVTQSLTDARFPKTMVDQNISCLRDVLKKDEQYLLEAQA